MGAEPPQVFDINHSQPEINPTLKMSILYGIFLTIRNLNFHTKILKIAFQKLSILKFSVVACSPDPQEIFKPPPYIKPPFTVLSSLAFVDQIAVKGA